jgi:predicted  nucleic acid-binding Zn-ribbon protein
MGDDLMFGYGSRIENLEGVVQNLIDDNKKLRERIWELEDEVEREFPKRMYEILGKELSKKSGFNFNEYLLQEVVDATGRQWDKINELEGKVESIMKWSNALTDDIDEKFGIAYNGFEGLTNALLEILENLDENFENVDYRLGNLKNRIEVVDEKFEAGMDMVQEDLVDLSITIEELDDAFASKDDFETLVWEINENVDDVNDEFEGCLDRIVGIESRLGELEDRFSPVSYSEDVCCGEDDCAFCQIDRVQFDKVDEWAVDNLDDNGDYVGYLAVEEKPIFTDLPKQFTYKVVNGFENDDVLCIAKTDSIYHVIWKSLSNGELRYTETSKDNLLYSLNNGSIYIV